MDIRVKNLFKAFNENSVLKNVNLHFKSGEIYCIMGSSGQGKTTLLKVIMGLERADRGEVYIDHKRMIFNETMKKFGLGRCRCEDRTPVRFSVVFQEDRLCQWLDAVHNVAMVGLPVSPGSHVTYAKEQLLKVLPEQSLNKPVCELSGGMRRRVAIVRAIAADSQAVLLDEPFTGLDEQTKEKVIQYILKEQRKRTLIVVSHQAADAAELGAQVVKIGS